MLFNILLALMMLDGVVLTAAVLMQAGQGGGLASLGGGTASQVLGGRAATTVLTKLTWITGGAFLALALVLSGLSTSRRNASSSDVGNALRQSATPVPVQTNGTGSAADILGNTQTNTPPVTGAPPATATGTGSATNPPAGKKPDPAPAPGKKP